MLLRFQCAPILTLIRLFRLCFYIRLLVLKHRQVSVHITNLPVLRFYRDAIVDLGYSGRENWQLQLWHASSYQSSATTATIFRLILISSSPQKTPAGSGGLTLLHDPPAKFQQARHLNPRPLPARSRRRARGSGRRCRTYQRRMRRSPRQPRRTALFLPKVTTASYAISVASWAVRRRLWAVR